jgi:hypothetical protein
VTIPIAERDARTCWPSFREDSDRGTTMSTANSPVAAA